MTQSILSLDIETSCAGKAEFRFYRPGFKIDSIALSWRTETGDIKSWFSATPSEIDEILRRISVQQRPIVVHNLAFEMGVFMKLYPDLQFNWAADTMRMAQMIDNGGDWIDYQIKTDDDILDEFLEGKSDYRTGLSLEAVASRFLGKEHHAHKAVAHEWLEVNYGVTTKHGSHLHLLPLEILRDYNIADTEITLRLYEELRSHLDQLGVDTDTDWQLYTTRCRLMQGAYIRGLKIDRERLREEIYAVEREIRSIDAEFQEKAAEPLAIWAQQAKPKRKKDTLTPGSFNVGSNAQLKHLFAGIMSLNAGKYTAKGAELVENKELTPQQAAQAYPSFASKHLSLWGPLGEVLYKRRKRLLVLQQMLGVYHMSDEGGRASPEVRVSGTRTNRVSGGRSE